MNTPEKLAQFLDERRAAPFIWGANDCCLFAADWIEELTGVDLMQDFRGKYEDARGAARLWRTVGGYAEEGENRIEALGWVEIEPNFAGRGDVVLLQSHRNHRAFGVMETGPVMLTQQGLTRAPRSAIRKAWRIK